MKTKYIKVSVKERLPEKEGDYFISSSSRTYEDERKSFFNGNRFKDKYGSNMHVDYWLHEVSDYEEEIKEMLEDNIKKSKQNIIFCTEKNMMSTAHSWEGRLMAYRECLEKLEGVVIFDNGCFCIERKAIKSPLHVLKVGLGDDIAQNFFFGYCGDFKGFLEGCEEDLSEEQINTLLSVEGEECYKLTEEIFNSYTGDLEIIGNIHSNPELLK